jgi:hypothetical protein
MWGGVTMGFAGVKFSGSLNKNGVLKLINKKIEIITMKPYKSLTEK